jgi:hypothetical protein
LIIAYCQATYVADFSDTLACVERVYKYVDYVIIVEDGSLNELQRQKLKAYPNLILKTVEFKDNLPEYRNAYLEEAKKLKADWVIVSDPDELFCEELLKDLRQIIDWAEANGYNMLGVNCREAFVAVEWLDDLDKLKESPGGYRESDFWKNLIFKLYPDLRYEGVGKTKTVHETWYSCVPWKAINLPKKYYYEHRKSALKIWRNAARNLFMGGGGDNVGDLNPYWVELRQICDKLGIKTWQEFESYLKKGNVAPELMDWLIKALNAKPTDYGVETRETAKYYFALHPEDITPGVEYLLKNPPEMDEEAKVETYVRKVYFQVLGRHPDREGLETYKRQILEGVIAKEQLPEILKSSPEYQRKFPLIKERVKIQVPVNIDVGLNDEYFIEALMKSDLWFTEIKPQLDIGKFILSHVKNREQFLAWFYKNKDKIKPEDLLGWLV